MNQRPLSRLLLSVLYGNFFFMGVVMGMTGPLVPALRSDLHLSYAQAGLVFSAQSLGSLAVLVLGGWLVHVLSKKTLLWAGGLVWFLGMFGTGWGGNFLQVLAGNVAIGAGMSLLDIGISTVILESFTEGKGKAVNRLHFFFGAGAVLGPMIALIALPCSGGWRWAFAVTGAIPLVAAALVPFLKVPATIQVSTAQKFGAYRRLFLWVGALALFVYCGVEWGLGAWLPSYWAALPHGWNLDPAWATSAFWLTFAVGRFVVGQGVDRWGFERFLRFSLVATAVITILWVLFPQPGPALVWIALFGLLIAGQYPTFVSFISQRFPESSGQVSSLLSVFASLGTFAWPPLVGLGADAYGMALLPWAELGMVLLFIVVSWVVFALGRSYRG